MVSPISFILHIDKYLEILIQNFGMFTYLILFLIILCETGLVITPFLPGGSLLFVAGALARSGLLNIFYLFVLLLTAAILGDTINYWIGKYFGEKVFLRYHLIKKEHLDKTHAFYEKHGAKTIILARFVPLIRTFAPFVAGVGKMYYPRFLMYNILGGLIWVSLLLLGGYFFGGIQIVRDNLTLTTIVIIIISILPGLFVYLKNRKN